MYLYLYHHITLELTMWQINMFMYTHKFQSGNLNAAHVFAFHGMSYNLPIQRYLLATHKVIWVLFVCRLHRSRPILHSIPYVRLFGVEGTHTIYFMRFYVSRKLPIWWWYKKRRRSYLCGSFVFVFIFISSCWIQWAKSFVLNVYAKQIQFSI